MSLAVGLGAPEPYWQGDGVTLYHGRCEDVMPYLVEPVDLVAADLPYGTTRNEWDRVIDPKLLWHLYHQLAGERTPVVLFGSGIFVGQMMCSNPDEFAYDLIWKKTNAVSGHLNAKKQPLRNHENLLVFYARQPAYTPQMVFTGRSSHSRGKRTDRTVNHYNTFANTEVVDQEGWQYPRSVLEFARPKIKGGHPNQKPIELMSWLVRSYSAPGELVLDNVCGSGSTLVAARNEGRRAIGIEMYEPYCEMAARRLESGASGDQW